jgi:hypothetical protein
MYGISVWEDEKVLDMTCDDGVQQYKCTCHKTVYFIMVETVNFMLCLFTILRIITFK